MRRHVERISYMHFKDIDPAVKADVIASVPDFMMLAGRVFFAIWAMGMLIFPRSENPWMQARVVHD